MRFIAIGSSVREELKGCIAELTVSFSEHSAPPAQFPDLLHNRDVSRMLNTSKLTLQHYRDTFMLPLIQIVHKCHYKRGKVEALLEKWNLKMQ